MGRKPGIQWQLVLEKVGEGPLESAWGLSGVGCRPTENGSTGSTMEKEVPEKKMPWGLSGIGGKASQERETGVQLEWLDQLKAQVGLLPPPQLLKPVGAVGH